MSTKKKKKNQGNARSSPIPGYTRETLERATVGAQHTQQAARDEEALCRADLLYAMLMHPDGERTKKVIDGCLKLVQKRSAPHLDQSNVFQRGSEFLRSDEDADGEVRVFSFLMMLHREAPIQKLVRRSYQPGNLWGDTDDANAHLDAFLEWLEGAAKATLSHPISEFNVIPTVRDFFDAAQRQYLAPQ